MINAREQQFLDTVADKSKSYIAHPRWFYLSDGTKYMPDFYCKEDDEYIEVAGTRQAYHANKHKYDLLKLEYPAVKFNVVHLWKHKRISRSPLSGISLQTGVSVVFLYKLKTGERHTTNKNVAVALATLTNKKPINFISPVLRKAYLRAWPELSERAKQFA